MVYLKHGRYQFFDTLIQNVFIYHIILKIEKPARCKKLHDTKVCRTSFYKDELA